MTVFFQTILASMAAIIIENVIFTTAFGTSTLIELSKKHWNILSFGGFITEFAVFSSIIAYFFEQLFQDNLTAQKFLPSVYVLSLGLVYIATLIIIRFISRKVFNSLKKYVHLSAFNCTVLSAVFANSIGGQTLGLRIINAVQIGIGFSLAAYLIYANNDKLNSDDIPSAFRGLPIHLLYIGIIAMIIFALGR